MIERRRTMMDLGEKPDPFNGFEYVDLGLPSGKLWAKCNVGAENPYDWGYYFSWGNVEPHTRNDGYSMSGKYNSTPGKSLQKDIPANSTYDAACAIMGGKWRMPTRTEFNELINNTNRVFVHNFNGSGVMGHIFKKKTDESVFIFIPNAGHHPSNNLSYGYYWASNYYTSSKCYGYQSDSGPNNSTTVSVIVKEHYRYSGFPIRGIISGQYKPKSE